MVQISLPGDPARLAGAVPDRQSPTWPPCRRGKLVLFLDEEIASRAPKRGKRRKAETQRLKAEGKRKKRKRESPLPSSTGAATADVIVVGGGPAKQLELDSDSDSGSDADLGDLGPDSSAVRASALKLQYSTVRLYSSAIVNLYAQQKARGENPAPHPNGLAKKGAYASYPPRSR
jgi:hypothetical protein